MPVDYNTAQQLIQSRGVQPPAGIQPGTPQYQQWATEWLQAAVNSGDPAAVQAAGGTALGQGGTEGGWEQEGGYVYDPGGQNAAPPSEWLGKRNPTPSELRRYAREAGWSEDFNRYSDRQLAGWINESWDPSINKFKGGVEKPTETGGTSAPGAGGGGGGGMGGGGGRGGGYGGAPQLELPEFVPPDWQTVMDDPGYQFALQQGQGALERSQAAQGLLRTGGSLKDLLGFGQGLATQYYGDAYNRAANTYNLNTGAQIAEFTPNWNAWQTVYGGDLQKYLQRENNIFGLLNQPPPQYPY